jgi:hypothetical protein
VNDNPFPTFLFENGFAVLAAVVGESTFGGPVYGKGLSGFVRGYVNACAAFVAKGLNGPELAKGFAETSDGC